MRALVLVLVLLPLPALAASSGAAPVCKAGKVVSYAPCETRQQCDALSRDCPSPPHATRKRS